MKKNNFIRFIFFVLLLFSSQCFGQLKELSVGDECPDVLMRNIINYKTTEARISDFKGKLLILDFWATWCAPCISMMPVTDSLQKAFEGKVQILPVTNEAPETVTAFMQNMQRSKHITLPSITGDTLLNTLFGHEVNPHYAWIDENGKVIAITGADKLNSATIRAYLNDKTVAGFVKKDNFKVTDESKPFFVVGNAIKEGNEFRVETIDDDDLFYHSTLTGYIDGFGCTEGADSTRITVKNESLAGLYRFAAGHDQLKMLLLNSTIWEVKNPLIQVYSDSVALELEKDRYSKTQEWMKKYTFCYELKFPSSLGNRKYDIMLNDLNNYFGALYHITGGIEKRKTTCLALVRTNNSEAFVSKGVDANSEYNKFHLKICNQPVYALLNFLSYYMDLLPPLIDETGYGGKTDIELNCDLSDPTAVNKALQPYGLQLVEKEKEKEMIVIKDKE